jgi:hypothetical protein
MWRDPILGDRDQVRSQTLGDCEFMMYSFDVMFEGQNVCRLGDPLLHNAKNTMG